MACLWYTYYSKESEVITMWYEIQKDDFTYLFFEDEETFRQECEQVGKEEYIFNGVTLYNDLKVFPVVFQRYRNRKYFMTCQYTTQIKYRRYVREQKKLEKN